MIVFLPVQLPSDFPERFAVAASQGQAVDFSADFHFSPVEMTAAMGADRRRAEELEQWRAGIIAAARGAMETYRHDMQLSFSAQLAAYQHGMDAEYAERLAQATEDLERRQAQAAPAPVHVTVSVPPGSINLRAVVAMPDTEAETTVEQDPKTGRISKTRTRTRATRAIAAQEN